MTPFHLEILLHYFSSGGDFPRQGPVLDDCRSELIEWGLLTEFPYKVTDKGDAWLHKVLYTPMPTQKWVWEVEPY